MEPAPPSPPPDSPPDPPSMRLPITLTGTWVRRLGLGPRLVDGGWVVIGHDHVRVVARRTGPIRGMLWAIVRLGSWLVFAAGTGAIALTSVGLAWRTRELDFLVWGPTVAFPLMILGLWAGRRLAQAVLEPWFRGSLSWEKVQRVASDGQSAHWVVRQGERTLAGALRVRASPTAREAMLAIQEGRLPGGRGEFTLQGVRSRWADRLVGVAGVGLALGAGLRLEPMASMWLLGLGEPHAGPLAGIPDRHTPEQLEALGAGACHTGSQQAPSVHNRREGTDLVWAQSPSDTPDQVPRALLHLGWKAASTRLHHVGGPDTAPEGRVEGFFGEDQQDLIGLSLVVAAADTGAVLRLLAGGEFEAFRATWCAGLVHRMDLTLAPPPPDAPVLRARRKGDDLVVEAEGIREGDLLLPVRWHRGPGPEVFHMCEVPISGRELGLVPARPSRRFSGFFDGPSEEARVYLLPAEAAEAARPIGTAGAAQRCLVADSLLYAGVAHARTTTHTGHASLLRDRAAAMAATPVLVPPGTDAHAAAAAIADRYRHAQASLMGAAQGPDGRDAINAGFLAGIDWTPVLGAFPPGDELPHLEVLRQRLSGADPLERMGEQFLMAHAEAWLDRSPPARDQWLARLELGETWLEIEPGKEWSLEGRPVRVPNRAVADTYQVIGRFMLMDLARRLERDLGAGRLSMVEWGLSWYLRYALGQHDVVIDVEKSTRRKALEAWVSGDFEYLADRIWKKTTEQLRDEQAALTAAWQADYALATQWSAEDGAIRTAEIRRNGTTQGWVGLYDAARLGLAFVPVDGQGTNRTLLAGGRPLLLATSGSYVTAGGRTSGLSVVGGTVKNFLVSPKMDGLVILRGDGSLAMLDMRAGGTLPEGGRSLRPLRSLTDFHHLLDWLRRDGASAFQTHLLGYGGTMTIDEAKADTALRERRLLVQASFRGHPIVGVVDLPGSDPKTLFEAGVIAHRALSTPEAEGGPGLTVHGIANLDVGSYDILEAWTDGGNGLRSGRVPLGQAMNLLTLRRP